MPNAVSTFLETPKNGQIPKNCDNTMLFTKIAEILGLDAAAAEPMVAVVRCNGTCANRPRVNQYLSLIHICVSVLGWVVPKKKARNMTALNEKKAPNTRQCR